MNSKLLSKLSNYSNALISISLLLTIFAFFIQKSSLNHRYLDVIDSVDSGDFSIPPPDAHSFYEKKGKSISVRCSVKLNEKNRFCGVVISFSTENVHGISLEDFQELHLNIVTESSLPNYNHRTRVFIKSNLNEAYSKIISTASFKYHAVRVEGNGDVVVPLSRFKVETWWEDSHNVPFYLSNVDMKSVASMEFFINDMPIKKAGDYSIKISDITLTGEIISDNDFHKMLSIFWFFLASGLFIRHLHLKFLEHKGFKNQAIKDPYCALLSTFGFDLRYSEIVGQEATVYRMRITNWNNLRQHFGRNIANQLLHKVIERYQSSSFSSDFFLGARLANDDLVFIKKGSRLSNDRESELLEIFVSPVTIIELGDLCLDIKVGVSSEEKLLESSKESLERAEMSIKSILREKMNFQVYSFEVARAEENKVHIESWIRQALKRDSFYLLYMPIFNAVTSKIVGVEALLRCRFPELCDMSPEIYISIAEETGLIRDIDLMVIEKALKEFDEANLHKDFTLSINISSKELLDTSFVNRFEKLVGENSVAEKNLCIEVTETFLLDVDPVSIKTIEKIREMGCKVSLDDFGTGYTSFQQLVHFPVDEIKIDRSFVSETGTAGYDAIIDSLISIAAAYNYSVVAEGVENENMYQRLKSRGCNLFQGYFISQPISLSEVIVLNKKIEKDGL